MQAVRLLQEQEPDHSTLPGPRASGTNVVIKL